MRLLRNVAAIALTLFHFRLRLVSAVGRKRSAYFYFLFELPARPPAHITAVAFVRFYHGSLTRLRLSFSCHNQIPLIWDRTPQRARI
jgi:hypothetical protein